MKKAEFLEVLRGRLTGEIPPVKIKDNIDYYDRYISEKILAGQSEDEVLRMLGDPNLIARTIIDTQSGKEEAYGEDRYTSTGHEEKQGNIKSRRLKPGTIAIIVIAVLVLVLFFVFRIIGALLPLVFPIIIVLLIVTALKRRG